MIKLNRAEANGNENSHAVIYTKLLNRMKNKIVAFGEVVWDILPHENILGGTPLNLVFRCNLFGEEGHLLSRVGDDDLGKLALKKLDAIGISTDNVQVDCEFPTGTVKVSFNEKNESVFDVTPDVAFDHIEFSTEALKLVRNADCLFFGLLPQRFGISKNTLRELINESPASVKFFDLKLFQHFFNTQVVEGLLSSAHIVRIKDKEVGFLSEKLGFNGKDSEEFCKQLTKKFNIDIALITCGIRGVYAFHKEKGSYHDFGYNIKINDSIGSGMAFSAGFLHYYLNGKSIQEAICFGNAAGALNATLVGATTPFNKNDVFSFMENTKKRTS